MMPEHKYYDRQTGRFLVSADGCPMDVWRNQPGSFKFGVHPAGFLIFLAGTQLDAKDEYGADDPYGVVNKSGGRSAFHERRFTGTIEMLGDALRQIRGRPRILDIGCGRGHITAEILRAFPAGEVDGLDCSLSAIATAHQTYSGIHFIVADAYDPPYASEYFDAVICNNIWEHVPDPLRLLEAIKRVLAPEGHLLISTPSRFRLGNLARVVMGRPVKFISPHHVTEYTVGQVIEQLRFGGFQATVYSPPLRQPANDSADFVLRKVLGPVVRACLRATGSHHTLEWTAFYLAKKFASCDGRMPTQHHGGSGA